MKKFILVDNEGDTPDHHHITEGKYLDLKSSELDDSVATIMKSGVNSPILALLEYPGAIDNEMKMFLLSVWNISADETGYTVVKEVPLPPVTDEHKLIFAIKAVREIYDLPAYTNWAEAWVNGSDRSLESVQKACESVDKEINELKEMEKVAYMYGTEIGVEKVAEKKALFERAKLVFTSAELALEGSVSQGFNDNIIQVFNGIEEYVEPDELSHISDEIIMVA